MADLELQLKNLEQKIKLLLKQYQQLQKENMLLKIEIEKKRSALDTEKTLIQKLQQQVDILNLGSPSVNGDDKKQLEERISGYLKEVEKCLALLNA